MSNDTDSPTQSPVAALNSVSIGGFCDEDSDCLNRTICVGKAFWQPESVKQSGSSICECVGTYGWEVDTNGGGCTRYGLGFMMQSLVLLALFLWNAVIFVVISENMYILIRRTDLKLFGETGKTTIYAFLSIALYLAAVFLNVDELTSPTRYALFLINGKAMKNGVHFYEIEVLTSCSITLLYIAMFSIQSVWIENAEKLNRALVLSTFPRIAKYNKALVVAQVALIISVAYFIVTINTFLIGFVVVPFSIILIVMFKVGSSLLATALRSGIASDTTSTTERIEIANRVMRLTNGFVVSLVFVVFGHIATAIYLLATEIPRSDAAPPGGFNRPIAWFGLIISVAHVNCLSIIVRYLHPSIRASRDKYLMRRGTSISNVGVVRV